MSGGPVELIQDTIKRFHQLYGNTPQLIATVPARINLIGEHTDYNDGYVLPAAIDRNIIIAGRRRDDRSVNLFSVDLKPERHVSLDDLKYDEENLWTNYPVGVAVVLQREGLMLKGADLLIRGNIPIGAGLSSSAAICVGSTLVLSRLNGIAITPMEIVKFAQQAETDFIGVQCGIMDQFVAIMGKKDHALFLDCKTLEYRHIPLPKNIRIIICDTGTHRELARSAYNQRRAECEDAVRQLTRFYPSVESLRDISYDQFQSIEDKLSPIARKRALHVISENDRVLKSVQALQHNRLDEFGLLMIESHKSLRDNYDVSSKELDAFVDIAVESEGVLGARMTGAGFGGSAICIVEKDNVDSFVQRLRSSYPKRAGRSLTIYISSIYGGATLIDVDKSSVPLAID
jgi:galactokinase